MMQVLAGDSRRNASLAGTDASDTDVVASGRSCGVHV